MIAQWMLYCVLCALGLSLAAVVAEQTLLAGRVPVAARPVAARPVAAGANPLAAGHRLVAGRAHVRYLPFRPR